MEDNVTEYKPTTDLREVAEEILAPIWDWYVEVEDRERHIEAVKTRLETLVESVTGTQVPKE